MKDLNLTEIHTVSGGRIRPSEWTWSAAGGALIGSACFAITSFSPNPVTARMAITVGMGIGAGLHATYDILRELGL